MSPDVIHKRLEIAAKRAQSLSDYLETFMSDMEHGTDSTTTLPQCFDDVLASHEQISTAFYTLQTRANEK